MVTASSVSEVRAALAEIRTGADKVERMLEDVSGKVAYVNGNKDLPIDLTDEQSQKLLMTINGKIGELTAAFPSLSTVDKLEAAPKADPISTPPIAAEAPVE